MKLDHHEIMDLQKRIHDTQRQLNHLVKPIGLALQVIDHSSDRRKRILAVYANAAPAKSQAEKESLARASSEYAEAMQEEAKELASAYEVQHDWRRLVIRMDACRSMLAITREVVRQMPESQE